MILFFDTETSGLPQKRPGDLEKEPHVLQLALSLYDDTRRPVFELSTLVVLPENAPLAPEAYATHKIGSALTHQYGISPAQALALLVALNDDHSPFGGEIYRDRIARTWDIARAALTRMKPSPRHTHER